MRRLERELFPANDGRHEPLRALERADLPLAPVALARFLIGVTLVRRLARQTMTARIVETEAYIAGDPAGHGFNGRTNRNAAIFSERGHAYIYQIYGVWWCLNVSAGKAGEGVGVLIRAAEPLTGLTAMQRRRPDVGPRDLLRGPGRLCQSLAIDGGLDGIDLTQSDALWLSARRPPKEVGKSARIGLTKAKDAVLRFYERGNPFVSGPARLNV